MGEALLSITPVWSYPLPPENYDYSLLKTSKNPPPTARKQANKQTNQQIATPITLHLLTVRIVYFDKGEILPASLTAQPQSQHRAFNFQEHKQVVKRRLWFFRLSDDLSNFLLNFFYPCGLFPLNITTQLSLSLCTSPNFRECPSPAAFIADHSWLSR